MSINFQGLGKNLPLISNLPSFKALEDLDETKEEKETEVVELEEEAPVDLQGNGSNYYNDIKDIEDALSNLEELRNSDKAKESEVQSKKSELQTMYNQEMVKKEVNSQELEDDSLTEKIIESTITSLNGDSLKDSIAIKTKVAELIKEFFKDEDDKVNSKNDNEDVDSARKSNESLLFKGEDLYSKFAQSHVKEVNALSSELNHMKNFTEEEKAKLDIAS